uniref:Uncharacterized protein n=1 Tax=Rhizophora mucronata TaxID=61149 RepID=A0A2P2PUA0_RHIMU
MSFLLSQLLRNLMQC